MPDIEVGGKALVSQSGTADPVIKSNVNFTGVIDSTATGTFTGNTAIKTSKPASPNEGDIYYDTSTTGERGLRVYDGIRWINIDPSNKGYYDAYGWWKSEDIGQQGASNGDTVTFWRDSTGNGNHFYFNRGRQSSATGQALSASNRTGALGNTLISSDSDFNNQKSLDFGATSTRYSCMTTHLFGSSMKYTPWSIMYCGVKTGHNSGTSLGDGWWVFTQAGTGDGHMSVELAGDHSWGGGYTEYFGGNATGRGFLNTKFMCLIERSGTGGSISYYPNASTGWTDLATSTADAWFADLPMYNLSIGHFPNQNSTSHRADGKMAEGIFWYGQSIPDSIRDAVTTYWISKFGFS